MVESNSTDERKKNTRTTKRNRYKNLQYVSSCAKFITLRIKYDVIVFFYLLHFFSISDENLLLLLFMQESHTK